MDYHLNGQLMSSLLIFKCSMSHGTMKYTLKAQGLGASVKKNKKTNYIILQGGELACFHFFKSSC